MSTVPETIVARHMGIEVLGISCVTNVAAGLSEKLLSHAEVFEAGRQVEHKLARLLTRLAPEIAATFTERQLSAGKAAVKDPLPGVEPHPFPPLVLGIAGCSGSGKTTLAAELARTLDGVHFPLDHYYLRSRASHVSRAPPAELRRSGSDRKRVARPARGGAGARRGDRAARVRFRDIYARDGIHRDHERGASADCGGIVHPGLSRIAALISLVGSMWTRRTMSVSTGGCAAMWKNAAARRNRCAGNMRRRSAPRQSDRSGPRRRSPISSLTDPAPSTGKWNGCWTSCGRADLMKCSPKMKRSGIPVHI